MDIEFIVQDTFVLTRPQWKLATNLEEAAKAFHLAIAQDQKDSGLDKLTDQDDVSVGSSSSDDGIEGDGDLVDHEAESDRESELGGDDEDAEADDDGDVSFPCSYHSLMLIVIVSG
jgi:regulator of nonsense transcripts 2